MPPDATVNIESASLKPSPFPILQSDPAPQGEPLAVALLRRDRKATAEFVAQHADVIHAYVARRLFPRTSLVEDMVQDVFMDALRGLHQYRGEAPLKHWLLSIARHKVQDYYRRQALEVEIEESGAEPSVEPLFDAWLDQENLSARVKRTMAELPESYRCLLLWRYWEKVPASEMAARLNNTEKSVERMLARAREQFRRRWEGE